MTIQRFLPVCFSGLSDTVEEVKKLVGRPYRCLDSSHVTKSLHDDMSHIANLSSHQFAWFQEDVVEFTKQYQRRASDLSNTLDSRIRVGIEAAHELNYRSAILSAKESIVDWPHLLAVGMLGHPEQKNRRVGVDIGYYLFDWWYLCQDGCLCNISNCLLLFPSLRVIHLGSGLGTGICQH